MAKRKTIKDLEKEIENLKEEIRKLKDELSVIKKVGFNPTPHPFRSPPIIPMPIITPRSPEPWPDQQEKRRRLPPDITC